LLNHGLQRKKRNIVSTENPGKAIIPDLPFENTNGTPFYIKTEYSGKKRLKTNSSPGPFEKK
jgi:alpha-L-arabinofuranosidase